ncbi:WhiB family transcriptional regulator [Pseudonocardia lutea]|uniref:WhiB family transcriptional regulator n=1 Tax=Pseudonocardia lutea TaxID=2172015 RepID=A0ABW1I8N5_9PSEU
MRVVGFPAGALCARPGTNPDLFFPDDQAPNYAARVAAARRVCADCPVQAACLADWMRREPAGARYGVVAGTTPENRDALAGTTAEPAAAGPFRPAVGSEAA